MTHDDDEGGDDGGEKKTPSLAAVAVAARARARARAQAVSMVLKHAAHISACDRFLRSKTKANKILVTEMSEWLWGKNIIMHVSLLSCRVTSYLLIYKQITGYCKVDVTHGR